MGLFSWFGSLFKSEAELDKAVGGMESKEVEGLNFATAVEAHNKWRARLQAVVDGTSTEALVPATVSQDNQCVLGKWIHGPGTVKFGHHASFTQLQATHAEFHIHAGRILQLAQGGQKDEAKKNLETGDYIIVSHRVRAQLASMYIELSSGRLKPR